MVRTAAVLPCLMAFAGCCSYEAQPLKQQYAAEQSMFGRTDEGLYYAGIVWTDPGIQERYLGTVATDEDILPIELLLENQSDQWDYTLSTDRIRMRLRDGTELEVLGLEECVDALGCSGWITLPWWFFFIFPGAIALGDVFEANEMMATDYDAKILTDRTVAGGKSLQKVLFLRPKEGSLDVGGLSDASLVIPLDRKPRAGISLPGGPEEIEITFH